MYIFTLPNTMRRFKPLKPEAKVLLCLGTAYAAGSSVKVKCVAEMGWDHTTKLALELEKGEYLLVEEVTPEIGELSHNWTHQYVESRSAPTKEGQAAARQRMGVTIQELAPLMREHIRSGNPSTTVVFEQHGPGVLLNLVA